MLLFVGTEFMLDPDRSRLLRFQRRLLICVTFNLGNQLRFQFLILAIEFLSISRHRVERIRIRDQIVIEVQPIGKQQLRLRIEAPEALNISRVGGGGETQFGKTI